MNVFNFFLIPEFIQILDLIGKSKLSPKYEFNGTEDLRLVIDTILKKNNDIVFTFTFYKKNTKVDITNMTTPHILYFLDKFSVYVQNLAPLKQDLKIPKYKTLLKHSKTSLTLMKSIIKQSDMSRKILYLYIIGSLNIYSVNGFNNVAICRTIIKSFDRINIISSEFINNKNLQLLMNLHNSNITLFNYFIQNNLSLFFQSLSVIITVVRIVILMVWIIYNVGIFSISGFSVIDPVVVFNNSFFYIVNLVFLTIWLFLPRIVVSIIKFKMKTGTNR
jgi:hypothetical protein